MVTAGVLTKRKQGRWIYFRLNRDNQEISPLLLWMEAQLRGTAQAEQDRCALKDVLKISCEELSRNQRKSGSCPPLNPKNKNNGKTDDRKTQGIIPLYGELLPEPDGGRLDQST
jgi:hypothetical protein